MVRLAPAVAESVAAGSKTTPKIDQTGPSTGSRNNVEMTRADPATCFKRPRALIDDVGRHLRGVSTESAHNRRGER